MNNAVGFGDPKSLIRVYIDKRPNDDEYKRLDVVRPTRHGEIKDIGQRFGNGWRKVFNIYAKLLFALPTQWYPLSGARESWQLMRDTDLLQGSAGHALLFSAPALEQAGVHIVMGKTYAQHLIDKGLVPNDFIWKDAHFAKSTSANVIICPYFDYRQLTNERIDVLVSLIVGTLDQ